MIPRSVFLQKCHESIGGKNQEKAWVKGYSSCFDFR